MDYKKRSSIDPRGDWWERKRCGSRALCDSPSTRIER